MNLDFIHKGCVEANNKQKYYKNKLPTCQNVYIYYIRQNEPS